MSNANQIINEFIQRNQSLAEQILIYAGVPASFSTTKYANNRAGLAAYIVNLEGPVDVREKETARVIEACGGDPRPSLVKSAAYLSGVQQAFLNAPPPSSPLPTPLPNPTPKYIYVPAQTSTFVSSLDLADSQPSSSPSKKEKTKKEEEKEKESTTKQASPTPITISETTRQNTVTENMFVSTISHLQQATGLETEALIPVATHICAARISLPDITTTELTDYIDTQIPYLETQGFRVNSLNSPALATHLHDFNLNATGPELVDQTVQAELTRSGLSLDQAHQLSPATTGFYDQVYQISGHVGRLDSPAQTISPQERQALNYQSQQLTDYLSFTHSEAASLIPRINPTQIDHSRVHATQEAVYGSPQNYSLTVDTPPQDYLIYLQNLQRTGVNLPAPLQATLQNYLNTPQGQEVRLDYLRPSLNSNPVSQRIYSNTDWGLSPSQALNYNLANHPSTILGKRILSPITRPFSSLNSRVLSPVATRVAGTAAGKATAAIATKVGIKAALQTLGSIVPFVGNAIAFVAGEIASKVLMKIGKFLKDNVGPIIGGLAGLSFGAFGGFGVMGVAVSSGVGAAGGAFTSAALTGTTSALTSSVSSYASSAFSGVAAAVGAGISGTAKSALVACFLLPVIVALTIFIINAGATVVPPSAALTGIPGGGIQPPGTTINGSCPIPNGTITCGSYGNTNTTRCTQAPGGHGSNGYWGSQASACGYGIPIGQVSINGNLVNRCRYTSVDSTSWCYQPNNLPTGGTCSTYGFAADVVPSTGAAAGAGVYLPQIGSQSLNWTFVAQYSIYGGSWGYGRVYSATDGTNAYRIYLGHMVSGGNQTGGPSGTLVGVLYDDGPGGFGPHVHIEMQVNGQDVRPDSLCDGTAVVQPPNTFCTNPINYGTSVDGRPLNYYKLGTGPIHRAIVGGIHGGYESNGIALTESILTHLCENPTLIPSNTTLYIVPNANPDGFAAGQNIGGRVNSNGVDLNRNWNYQGNWRANAYRSASCSLPVSGGSGPYSEPETFSLRSMLITQGISSAIFYHSMITGGAIFYGGYQCESQSYELAQSMGAVSGYAVPSSFGEHAFTGVSSDSLSEMGISTIEIELPSRSSTDWSTNLNVLQSYLNWSPSGGGCQNIPINYCP